ncbi:Epsin-3, clathrin recruitment and traffic between the Golgi and endosome [Rhizophlyctis rosea]|uniref:Epsin-3, clathrin recruitment and traffic between the Golgi and endosome n=1 Tax=Rhizophlyctis rosea TaxID=64517 RepID=A0AAD5SCM7_9FUNG|nr:Epsin-3, clathrin recruitment and traffic between the Golgi and endosome [Rhizophlyctis rosea]
MDLSSITGQLSNYIDVRGVTSMVNKVKYAVQNLTEMEVKVHEATNNEPWGASSTTMQEIAAGMFNELEGEPTTSITTFTEIMETIYRRLQEKHDAQWRQCYKALQLLEYLIKNGSERVVDNARDHIYELKALRNFHYIDDKGKDQGINVRNRAQEIQDLLANNDKIKEERRKAKDNRNKYTGVSSDGFGSGSGGFGGGGSGRYGGFSSEDYRASGGFRDDSRPATPSRFESSGASTSPTRRSESRDRSATAAAPSTSGSGKIVIKMAGGSNGTSGGTGGGSTQQPTADLLGGGDGDVWGDFTSAGNGGAAKQSNGNASGSGFDDFADFQSANTTTVTSAQKPSQPTSFIPSQPSFASFPSAQPQQALANTGFAQFASFPSSNAATQPVNKAAPAAGIDLLGDFGGGGGFGGGTPTNPMSAQSFGQPLKPAGSANLAQPKPTTSTPSDPFSKLVSLDATALSGAGKKEEGTGPSLNSIGWAAPTQMANGSGFAAFGGAQPMGVRPGFANFGQQGQTPQQQQQQQGGFGAFGGQSLF